MLIYSIPAKVKMAIVMCHYTSLRCPQALSGSAIFASFLHAVMPFSNRWHQDTVCHSHQTIRFVFRQIRSQKCYDFSDFCYWLHSSNSLKVWTQSPDENNSRMTRSLNHQSSSVATSSFRASTLNFTANDFYLQSGFQFRSTVR